MYPGMLTDVLSHSGHCNPAQNLVPRIGQIIDSIGAVTAPAVELGHHQQAPL